MDADGLLWNQNYQHKLKEFLCVSRFPVRSNPLSLLLCKQWQSAGSSCLCTWNYSLTHFSPIETWPALVAPLAVHSLPDPGAPRSSTTHGRACYIAWKTHGRAHIKSVGTTTSSGSWVTQTIHIVAQNWNILLCREREGMFRSISNNCQELFKIFEYCALPFVIFEFH